MTAPNWPKPSKEKIVMSLATESCFYVDESGVTYRIQYCGDDAFVVLNEDTGDEHTVWASEVTPTCKFHRLVTTTVEELLK